MECATWVLCFFSGILTLSTIAYTLVTYKLFKGSIKQVEALENQVQAMKELTNAVNNIPITEHRIKENIKNLEKLHKSRDESSPQKKAVTGRH